MLRIFIILIILFVIDLYVFNGIRFLSKNMQPHSAKMLHVFFWFVTASCFAFIIAGYFYDWRLWPKAIRTYSFAFIFVTYFSKLFLVLFLVMDDLFRGARWVADTTGITEPQKTTDANGNFASGISRSGFLVRLGVIIAALPFTALIIGMMKGKYEYQVRKVKLSLNNLPSSFNGFKIVQISDLHTGSFNDTAPIEKAVQMINDLKPDVIFFTGDLVNDKHTEVIPYMNALSNLKAEHGVFSILGNHDYGDYVQWSDKQTKEQNLAKLINAHKEMGWDILLDEHRHIEKNGERISSVFKTGVQE